MCLLKVYVDEGKSGKKLVAEEIALVAKDNDKIKLKFGVRGNKFR